MIQRITVYAIAFLTCFSIFSQEQPTIDSLDLALKQAKNNVDKVEIILAKAIFYKKTNKDSAKSYFDKAVSLAENNNLSDSYVNALVSQGIFLTEEKAYEAAGNSFSKAAPSLNNVEDQEIVNLFYQYRGTWYYQQSDFTRAKVDFEKALDLAIQIEDAIKQMEMYSNLGSAYQELASFEKSVEMYQKSLVISKDRGITESSSRSLNNLSILFQRLEDFEKAERYMLESLKLSKNTSDKKSMVIDYINLGIVNRRIGERDQNEDRLEKAEELYKKALALSEEIEYVVGKGSALANLALVSKDRGDVGKAVFYGEQAVAFNVENNNLGGEMISRLNLGASYSKDKQFAKSETELRKSLAIAKRVKYQLAIQENYSALAELYDFSKQYEKAFEYQKKYTQLKDSLSSVEVKNKVNELETKYQTQVKENEILEQRAQLAESDLQIRKKNNIIYGVIGVALLLGLLGYLLYNQQRLKNEQLRKESDLKEALSKIETQNHLQEQRLRISRDLHDNIGSQLTFIISSLDNLKYGLKDADSKIKTKLGEVGSFTKNTINELRDTIWAMNKESISLEDIEARIANLLEQARTACPEIIFELDFQESIDKTQFVTSVEGVTIYRIIQEAINNAIKHSKADYIEVSLSKDQNKVLASVKDDGKGFDINNPDIENGLLNMKKRAKDIAAIYTIHSKENEGTFVSVILDMNS